MVMSSLMIQNRRQQQQQIIAQQQRQRQEAYHRQRHGGGSQFGSHDHARQYRHEYGGGTPTYDEMADTIERIQNARLEKGELTKIVDGQAPMKSALDLGDETAIRTLVELDEETLTKPCCSIGPALTYLRLAPGGHEHAAALIPLVEGLLLQQGFVPLADGVSLNVDLFLGVLKERSEDKIKERLRSGEIDFRQFKALRALIEFPEGFEEEDPKLAFLIQCALDRHNPHDEGGGKWSCVTM